MTNNKLPINKLQQPAIMYVCVDNDDLCELTKLPSIYPTAQTQPAEKTITIPSDELQQTLEAYARI